MEGGAPWSGRGERRAMVLRGSKIRPESTLEDANAAVARARDFLRQTRKELRSIKSEQVRSVDSRSDRLRA